MTSKQKVLSKYPNARAEKIKGERGVINGAHTVWWRIPTVWYIKSVCPSCGHGEFTSLGQGSIESQAWVNAAKSLEEKK